MRPHIWFDRGQWWVAYSRDALIRWSGQTIRDAWNRRVDWLNWGGSPESMHI